jgi:hypothetical protein
MEALDICRKEAGLLPQWILNPDEIEASFYDEKNQILCPYSQFVLDYSSALSIKTSRFYVSLVSISICGVTLTHPLSCPPTIPPN